MPNISLRTMQCFAIAICNGNDTVDKLMAEMSYKHNGVREVVRQLEKKQLRHA